MPTQVFTPIYILIDSKIGDSNIVAVIMDGDGMPTAFVSVGSSYNDSNPSLAYNPSMWTFVDY